MICLIAALSKNYQIGIHNQMPWHIPEDLSYFRQMTTGHTVIMGRKTYESIGKPLPNRNNVVLTTNPHFSVPKVTILNSFSAALDLCCNTSEPIFIIGGGEIYKAFLPYADRLYLTLINQVVVGDTSFPQFEKDFKLIQSLPSQNNTSTDISYTFTIWERCK